MSRDERGHLRALPSAGEAAQSAGRAEGSSAKPTDARRRLAPGAPTSPGTVPLELAQQLRMGEAVVWWDEKEAVSWRPVAWTMLAGLIVLAGVTVFVPELWRQPLRELWKPIAAVFSPAAFVFAREWLGRRATLVTDNAIVDVDHRGRADRIGFRNVRRVRRDLLTGGVLLEGEAHKVRIPPALSEAARQAVASQMAGTIRASNDPPEDRLGWLP